MNTDTKKFGDRKVLACVDQSPYAALVTDAAAWAAVRMQAPLELLHVINKETSVVQSHDHSGAIGMNAQETLLGKLAEDDAIEAKAAREQGRAFLNRLRERAQFAGVPSPDMRQRHGTLVETLTEQQADVRLVVMGRRGESAQATSRDLGRHVERVVRAMDRPILTVTDNFSAPQRVLIAFDGGSASRHAVDMVASSPLFKGTPCCLFMVGKSEDRDASKQLEAAHSTLVSSGIESTALMIAGDPETAIARAIQDQGIDMLIMGAYTHSPIRSLFAGSKTTELLRSARVPTMLLR